MDEVGGSVKKWNYDERRHVIKQKAREIGLSQLRLARMASITEATISRFLKGHQDVKPETLERIEGALTDAVAIYRETEQLHSQRIDAAPLAQMSPPPPGSELYWRARDQYVQQGSQRMAELVSANAQLNDTVSNLREQIKTLKNMMAMLKRQAANWHEAFTLQDELICLYEAERVKRPNEADSLLERARLLASAK